MNPYHMSLCTSPGAVSESVSNEVVVGSHEVEAQKLDPTLTGKATYPDMEGRLLYSGAPGAVALSFLHADFSSAEGIGKWSSSWGGVKIRPTPGGRPTDPERCTAVLKQQQDLMGAFVASVLLLPAPPWGGRNFRPTRRVGLFYRLWPAAREIIEERLQSATISLGTKDTFRGGFLPSEEPGKPRRLEDLRPDRRLRRELDDIEAGYSTFAEQWGQATGFEPADFWEREFERLSGATVNGVAAAFQATSTEVATWEVETDDLIALAWAELALLAAADLPVKKCRACGAYFVPNLRQTVNCPTCSKGYNRRRRYKQKRRAQMTPEEVEAAKKHEREYMREYRRRKRLEVAKAQKKPPRK